MNNKPVNINPENGQLVSIAMCTFNGAKYVSQQIDSILAQSHKNLEIIIVDDASTDNTLSILQDYANKDPRITAIGNTQNLGYVKNFEKAISLCTADYIALADQDDIWLPNKISTLLSEIGDNWLIYSKVTLIDELGTPLEKEFPDYPRLEGACALSLAINNCVTGHATLIHKNLINHALPFPRSITKHDQWLAIISALTGRLAASQMNLSYYRSHTSNALLNKNKSMVKKPSKARRKSAFEQELIDLLDEIAKADITSKEDVELVTTLSSLLKRNKSAFINHKLKRFLCIHEDTFLSTQKNRKKYRDKLCRGYWFHKLFPFT